MGIEVAGKRGRSRRKLLDDFKERRWYSHLKEEALDRTMWRARFGRGFGPVVRQSAKWINDPINVLEISTLNLGLITLHIYIHTGFHDVHNIHACIYKSGNALVRRCKESKIAAKYLPVALPNPGAKTLSTASNQGASAPTRLCQNH
jgi:hypothetical protein